MQAVAKEMNFSETTFVLPAERPDTDVRMRIFTPCDELPMAGHPTVGSAFALAHSGAIAKGREEFVFGLGVGPISVALTWTADDLSFVWMTQRPPIFGEPGNRSLAAAALSLPESALAPIGLPVQVVSCGVPFLFVPIATRAAVDASIADRPALDELVRTTPGGAHGVFFFSHERGSDDATVYSRMFAPALGVPEDPATGGASGPLGCYLVRHGLVAPENAGRMLSLQGVKMGRPSHIHISIGMTRDEITSVRIGGESVLAGEGTLYI